MKNLSNFRIYVILRILNTIPIKLDNSKPYHHIKFKQNWKFTANNHPSKITISIQTHQAHPWRWIMKHHLPKATIFQLQDQTTYSDSRNRSTTLQWRREPFFHQKQLPYLLRKIWISNNNHTLKRKHHPRSTKKSCKESKLRE